MARVNWAQAAAEVSLLALGVVIALGGDAWMDSARERATELAYLEALRADIAETESIASGYIATQQGGVDATVALLEALAAPMDEVGIDSLDVLMERAFWIHTWNPQRGTYQDLVNSGSLGLIERVELRSALAYAAEIDEDLKRFDDLQWQHWMDLELPFLTVHSDIGRTYQNYTSLRAPTPIRFPASGSSADPQTLRSTEFRNIIVARSLVHQDAISTARRVVDGLGELQLLIDEELRRFN